MQIMKMWSKTLDLSPLLATSDRALVDVGRLMDDLERWEDVFTFFSKLLQYLL